MSSDLLTVVTCTIGDSCGHLNRTMVDLHAFTSLSFRHIVSDDGTKDIAQKSRQREVTLSHGGEWTENPGPVWGVSYNLNHALSLVRTPWVLLVEDGLRPGWGWLETAVDAIERIGQRQWPCHPVGMMGTASLQDWHLAMAGALPTSLTFHDFIDKSSHECYSAFWGGEQWPNWNDGLWCWRRLLPGMQAVCGSPEATGWPYPHPGHFRDLIRGLPLPYPHNVAADQVGYRPWASWPERRKAGCGWFPGAFMLLNVDAWRQVGRFRDGCTFFEGHLGIRMAQAGYLSLCLDFPPWLHFESLGFRVAPSQGKVPRHHEDSDGPQGILMRDFGCNGEGHCDLYQLVDHTFPQEEQQATNEELASIELYMDPHWREWL